MNKIALVTGASSGIGQACARILANNNFDLIICGRRQDRLDSLKQELSSKCSVRTLNFDVRDKAEVDNVLSNIGAIDVLLNNAGNAHGLSSIEDGSLDDWDAMIDINVKGLLYVSKSIIPGMIERKSGHIVNIGSIAGKEVYANGNVYCGSKHAVDAINNGMRMDLNKHGIKVSQISPGLVETEFSVVRFKGDSEKAAKVYDGIDALQADDIAELFLFMVTRPAHVNLSDAIVLPTAQASSSMVRRD